MVQTKANGAESTLSIMVRHQSACTQKELEGNWTWHLLRTRPGDNAVQTMQSTIDASGAVTFTTETALTKLILGSNGTITDESDHSLHGVLSPGKNLIILTRNAGAVLSTPSIWIGMRR
jgi:hypothetical protein